MKASEIRELTLDEIAGKTADKVVELFNLRFQHATGQLENPMKMKEARREIAKLKTIQKQMEGSFK